MRVGLYINEIIKTPVECDVEGVFAQSKQKIGRNVGRLWHKVPWDKAKKVLSIAFFIAVAVLLFVKAREIEWSKVIETLRATPLDTLVLSVVLAFLCYGAYASYDLFGRYILNTKASALKTWIAAWISYACNLNLGALIGSVAFRYRLYSRLGVKSGTVTRIIGISVASNWLGYILLAGGLFVSGAVEVPENWKIGDTALRVLGAAFLVVIAGYLYLCAFSGRRELDVRGHTLTLPSLKMALLQFAVACAHWTLMAAVMFQFFEGQVAFTTVYAVLLISCVAGAVSHIPGGLGVLEAVFIALLAGEMERYQVLAAVFGYRCVFYFIPLLVAVPAYLIYEAKLGGASTDEHAASDA